MRELCCLLFSRLSVNTLYFFLLSDFIFALSLFLAFSLSFSFLLILCSNLFLFLLCEDTPGLSPLLSLRLSLFLPFGTRHNLLFLSLCCLTFSPWLPTSSNSGFSWGGRLGKVSGGSNDCLSWRDRPSSPASPCLSDALYRSSDRSCYPGFLTDLSCNYMCNWAALTAALTATREEKKKCGSFLRHSSSCSQVILYMLVKLWHLASNFQISCKGHDQFRHLFFIVCSIPQGIYSIHLPPI